MPNTMPNSTRAPQVLPATAQCPKAVQPPQNLPQEFRARLTKLPLALVSVSATAGKNAPTENHPTTGRPAPTPCGPRSTKTMATKTLAPTATASNIGGVGVRSIQSGVFFVSSLFVSLFFLLLLLACVCVKKILSSSLVFFVSLPPVCFVVSCVSFFFLFSPCDSVQLHGHYSHSIEYN